MVSTAGVKQPSTDLCLETTTFVPTVILAVPQRDSELHHNADERRRGTYQLPAGISRANLLEVEAAVRDQFLLGSERDCNALVTVVF